MHTYEYIYLVCMHIHVHIYSLFLFILDLFPIYILYLFYIYLFPIFCIPILLLKLAHKNFTHTYFTNEPVTSCDNNVIWSDKPWIGNPAPCLKDILKVQLQVMPIILAHLYATLQQMPGSQEPNTNRDSCNDWAHVSWARAMESACVYVKKPPAELFSCQNVLTKAVFLAKWKGTLSWLGGVQLQGCWVSSSQFTGITGAAWRFFFFFFTF